MLGIFQRHPRYSISTAVGILVVLLLLTSQHSSISDSLSFGGKYGSSSTQGTDSGRASLSERLREAEVDYNSFLARRKDFIKTIGPDPAGIAAFPGGNKMYTLWDFFLPAFQCPHRVQRIGVLGDGGKYVCGIERVARKKSPCVVYSFGVNGESSYEAAIIESTHCEVWGYDFSVDKFGPEIDEVPSLKARSHFFAYGLGGKDDHEPGASPPMWTLPSLMKLNGHEFIDILKIDIEGSEFSLLTDLIRAYRGQALPFGQLQLEVHAWGKSFNEFLNWWEALEDAGLRPFWTEPNLVYLNLYRGHAPDLAEYSFINIKANHALTSDS